MNATATPAFANDMFRQMSDNFAKAVQTGSKAQDEVCRAWNDATARTSDDFRNRVERFADEVLPATKKNAERVTKLFEEQTQRTTAFVRTAMESNVFTTPFANPADAMDRTMNFWKSAFETGRESFDAFNRAGQDMWSVWAQFGKCCDTMPAAPTIDNQARKPVAK